MCSASGKTPLAPPSPSLPVIGPITDKHCPRPPPASRLRPPFWRIPMSSIAAPRPLAVNLIVLVIAGCVIAAVTNGIRTTFGLFTLPVTADLGVSREAWGLAMAIQNLAWGVAQPIAGGL